MTMMNYSTCTSLYSKNALPISPDSIPSDLPIRFPLDLHSHTVAMTDHGDCPTQAEVTQTFSMTPAAASSEGIGACN